MQRAFSIAMALAAVALSAVLAFKGAQGSLSAMKAGSPDASSAAPLGGTHTDVPDSDVPHPDVIRIQDAGDTPSLLSGRGPGGGSVRFGVILVTYDGAEGAPKTARSRSAALALATTLATEAKTDFHAAVQRGDTGSTDDVGEVTRGVLEPASEGVLFTLPVGAVSDAVDTPRGFWIVKRLE